MHRLTSIVFVIGLFVSLPALAATVEVVEGQVSINRGHGFQQVAGTADAYASDSVMANPGGRGKIVYPDGCVVDVYPGAVVTVEDRDPKALPGPCKVAGAPIWPYVAGAALIAAPIIIVTDQEEHRRVPRSP
jgi:hypothetical protein